MNEKLEHVQWGEYTYNQLFRILPTSVKLTKTDLDGIGDTAVYSSISDNNGIMGYTTLKPSYIVEEKNPIYIIFGDHTRTFNISKTNFSVMDNVKVLKPLQEYNLNHLLFIISAWAKCIPNKGYSRHWSIAKKVKFKLPTKNGKIDFEFMESFVAELEAQRVAELEAYLTVTGLKDYKLTGEEEKAIEQFEKLDWKEYAVEELFEVNSYKKRFDANKVEIYESGHPYIVRTAFNNGVKGYLQEDNKYLNEGNTISFGQDTATVFYQKKPYFTGDKIKILNSKIKSFNENKALFLISCMRKSFSSFSWGRNSFNEKAIKSQKIKAPVNNYGKIDEVFMEEIIMATKKLVIKDVVEWADKKIEATKVVVNR
nr:restriction endonuclease subunit S [Anaerosalibacter sp. Marseille-P3206]